MILIVKRTFLVNLLLFPMNINLQDVAALYIMGNA